MAKHTNILSVGLVVARVAHYLGAEECSLEMVCGELNVGGGLGFVGFLQSFLGGNSPLLPPAVQHIRDHAREDGHDDGE